MVDDDNDGVDVAAAAADDDDDGVDDVTENARGGRVCLFVCDMEIVID